MERLHQCIQFVDATSRSSAAMNIEKHYAWQSGNSNSRENSPLLPRNVRGRRKEWMWDDHDHLQSPAPTQLIGLQSLVRFWKESPPTGVQGVEERIRSGFEQTADFQCVR